MRLLFWALMLLVFAASSADATIISSIPYNLTNGSLADATQVMGNFNTIVSDVNANSANAGANSNITSLTGLTTPLIPSAGGTAVFTGGTSTGSANAQLLATTVPGNFALTAGNIVTGIAGYTNTGTATLNVGGTGVTAVKIQDSTGLHALAGGEIFTGNPYTFYYDGTEFVLLNPSILTAARLPAYSVTGASSSASGDVATFNGTGGTSIQDGGVLLSALAPKANPTFTGTPAAPTATSGTATTQLATTAFAYGALSAASNGYVTLPNGLMIQWGKATASLAATAQTISLPTSFANACLNAQTTVASASDQGAIDSGYITVSSCTTTQIVFLDTIPRYWMAIGY